MDESHALYGSYIGVQFVLNDRLDHKYLNQAITQLITALPALSGRADFKNGCVDTGGGNPPELEIITGAAGNAADHAVIGTAQTGRFSYINEPRRSDIFAGRAPLSTFRLTEFTGGGCIFGMGISHALVDGAGFHMLARYVSNCYVAYLKGETPPEPPFSLQPAAVRFGTGKSKTEVKTALKRAGIASPIPAKGFMGKLWSRIIMGVMEKNRKTPRAVFYMSAAQVAALKRSVLIESGEDWISTNLALGAHFAKVMARLQFGDKAKTQMQIGQVLDIRGRFFEDIDGAQSAYPGNAILIYTDLGHFPNGFQNTPRGDIARFMKTSLARLDGDFVKDRLDVIEDALQCGFTYPGLDIRRPMIAVNNQSKMDVYAADFGQALLRVIPQDVGDHIMIYPAKEGGVEVYLRDLVRAGGQKRLYEDVWQSEIFAVEG